MCREHHQHSELFQHIYRILDEKYHPFPSMNCVIIDNFIAFPSTQTCSCSVLYLEFLAIQLLFFLTLKYYHLLYQGCRAQHTRPEALWLYIPFQQGYPFFHEEIVRLILQVIPDGSFVFPKSNLCLKTMSMLSRSIYMVLQFSTRTLKA